MHALLEGNFNLIIFISEEFFTNFLSFKKD